MTTYPTISLWQSWASLLFIPGAKAHETRHWPVPHRLVGRRILIHAAKHPIARNDYDADDAIAMLCANRFSAAWRQSLPFGAFVGSAPLQSCRQMPEAQPLSRVDEMCGNWEPGRWAWLLTERRAFSAPIPAKGQQGFWTAEIEDRP